MNSLTSSLPALYMGLEEMRSDCPEFKIFKFTNYLNINFGRIFSIYNVHLISQ